jgi:hypothetical protein
LLGQFISAVFSSLWNKIWILKSLNVMFMKINLFSSFFVAMLLLISCSKTDSKTYALSLGEFLQVGKNLSLEADSLNDSRCPLGATCFTSGDVQVFMRFRDGNQIMDTALCLGQPGCRVQWAGFNWVLTKVSPYPRLGETIKPSDYRVFIRRESL